MVRDGSMRPTLLPGDRIYVDPAAFRLRPPAAGSLVVVRDPERPSRWLVKCVQHVAGERLADGRLVPGGTVFLVGDDPAVSRDSRAFGPVRLDAVVGGPWFRYLPPERRGPLPGAAA